MAKRGRPVKEITILPKKERAFVEAYVETGGDIQAAGEHAGVSTATAYRWAQKQDILTGIMAAYDQAGITPDRLANTLSQALDAKRTLVKPDGKGGATLVEVDDWRIRLGATKLILDSAVKMRALQIAQERPEDRVTLPDNVDTMSTEEIAHVVTRRTVLTKRSQ